MKETSHELYTTSTVSAAQPGPSGPIQGSTLESNNYKTKKKKLGHLPNTTVLKWRQWRGRGGNFRIWEKRETKVLRSWSWSETALKRWFYRLITPVHSVYYRLAYWICGQHAYLFDSPWQASPVCFAGWWTRLVKVNS